MCKFVEFCFLMFFLFSLFYINVPIIEFVLYICAVFKRIANNNLELFY